MASNPCSVRVYGHTQPFGGSMCSKPAKVLVNGRNYCAIHDPAAELKRRQKSDAKWSAEREAATQKYAAQKEMQRRADCYPELLSALNRLLSAMQCPVDADLEGADAQEEARAAIAKATP